MKRNILFIFSIMTSMLMLGGCSELELASHFGKKVSGSKVPSKGYYKVGSPYSINGKKYYPNVDYDYSETGIASWYGPGFNGKRTANGEVFDENELTAAHKTLPLPSIVRVTNLENGKSLIVRVNDRGPYAHGRVIDLSKRSAELLGFKNKGVAKVKVQVLEDESVMIAKIAQSGKDTRGMEVPMNKPGYKAGKVMQASYEAPSERPVIQAQMKADDSVTVPGHIKNGDFYPDPVVSEFPVTEQSIFVQTGAYSTREGAMKAASSLDRYGRAQVFPVNINGQTIFRVRFLANSVANADALLKNLIAGGHKDALIVVEEGSGI